MKTRKDLFDVIRPFAPDEKFNAADVAAIDALADAFGLPKTVPPQPVTTTPHDGRITEAVALELIGHEAIVQEAYRDSKGIWTWSIGITNASGHNVDRYKDKPQPLSHCLAVYVWLLRTKYGPEVMAAFNGFPITETQFGAALSFHYNTGAIGRASWVKLFRAGKVEEAKASFMEWRNPPEIIKRREAERDLFFKGIWSADGLSTVYPVAKPSYTPHWRGAKRIDIRADLKAALQAA